MDLYQRKDLNREEYILLHTLQFFGMKKVGGEKIAKIQQSEETK
jgi:hypothetical protein